MPNTPPQLDALQHSRWQLSKPKRPCLNLTAMRRESLKKPSGRRTCGTALGLTRTSQVGSITVTRPFGRRHRHSRAGRGARACHNRTWGLLCPETVERFGASIPRRRHLRGQPHKWGANQACMIIGRHKVRTHIRSARAGITSKGPRSTCGRSGPHPRTCSGTGIKCKNAVWAQTQNLASALCSSPPYA